MLIEIDFGYSASKTERSTKRVELAAIPHEGDWLSIDQHDGSLRVRSVCLIANPKPGAPVAHVAVRA